MEHSDKYSHPLNQRELLVESSVKSSDRPEDTLSIAQGPNRVPSPNPSLLSIDDSNNIRPVRNPDYVPVFHSHACASHSSASSRTLKDKLRLFWVANKGLGLVLISQLFGTLMNVTTRMLEMEGNQG